MEEPAIYAGLTGLIVILVRLLEELVKFALKAKQEQEHQDKQNELLHSVGAIRDAIEQHDKGLPLMYCRPSQLEDIERKLSDVRTELGKLRSDLH